ncbi:MAG: hypothetical protein LBL82_01885 [Oscillospiraceae bacterium]|jgi:uncharacterized Zn finger protein (UPF0148 family)|nr:hypothetical protein [Oscillospiraceae bacterium]
MKKVMCEMCGSVDLVKQDGVFLCQACGTKYSVEEVKKMLVEIDGAVKIDHSEFVDKQLANARRALEKGDWEETEKYYNLVEQHQPNSIEAVFFSSYSKVMQSFTDADKFKRAQKFSVLNKSVSVIDEYYEKTTEDKEAVIEKISSYIIKMVNTPFVFTQRKNGYGIVISDERGECHMEIANANSAFIQELVSIVGKNNELYINNLIIKHCELAFTITKVKINRDAYFEIIRSAHLNIQKLDPSHTVPSISDFAALYPVNKKVGCYIASAVYGSYDCPEVWTLRRYRDSTLASTWYGRMFVRTYYAISPALVRRFGEKSWFKRICHNKLDVFVAKLQSKGFESTPYNDRFWE